MIQLNSSNRRVAFSCFHKKLGYSLPETMLALVILGLLSVGIFYMISATNRSSHNSYHIYLAEQIAHEPLEIFSSLGYKAILDLEKNIGIEDYKVNQWQKLEQKSQKTGIVRPAEVAMFERFISCQRLAGDNTMAFLVQVKVRPAKDFRDVVLLSRNEVVCSDIIIKQQ